MKPITVAMEYLFLYGLGLLGLYAAIMFTIRFYFYKKDRSAVYKVDNLNFQSIIVDGKEYIAVAYNDYEKNKKKFIQRIPQGARTQRYVIINQVGRINKMNLHLFHSYYAFFRYRTIYEEENAKHNIHTQINQNVANSAGDVFLNASADTYTEINIESWNQEIYKADELSNDDKVLILEIISDLKRNQKVEPSMAQKCINLISGMNTMVSFGKNLIEILTKFL